MSAQDFVAPVLVEVAQAEWESQLLPFVPDCPAVGRVLKEFAEWIEHVWPET